MPPVIGHTRQREVLARLATRDRLPATLLFSGIPGIGKRRVADELARQVLCSDKERPAGGCGDCQSCVLFEAGTHPDLHNISFAPDSGTKVDDLRAMLERLSLKAFLGGRKVAILDDADHLSIVGSNVVLKSLEEPRPGCFFFLVAANPARLPATLVSRCQRWFFDRLSNEHLKEVLDTHGIDGLSSDTLQLADGSVTEAEKLHAQQDILDDVRHVVEAAHAGEEHTIGRAAQAWGSDKDLIPQRLGFLRMIVHRKLRQSGAESRAAAVWAHALQNILDAEYLMIDRHVTPAVCFSAVLRSCRYARGAALVSVPGTQLSLWEQVQR